MEVLCNDSIAAKFSDMICRLRKPFCCRQRDVARRSGGKRDSSNRYLNAYVAATYSLFVLFSFVFLDVSVAFPVDRYRTRDNYQEHRYKNIATITNNKLLTPQRQQLASWSSSPSSWYASASQSTSTRSPYSSSSFLSSSSSSSVPSSLLGWKSDPTSLFNLDIERVVTEATRKQEEQQQEHEKKWKPNQQGERHSTSIDAQTSFATMQEHREQERKKQRKRQQRIYNCALSAARRAEGMLRHMSELHDSGSRTVRPNAQTYAIVISAYGRVAETARSLWGGQKKRCVAVTSAADDAKRLYEEFNNLMYTSSHMDGLTFPPRDIVALRNAMMEVYAHGSGYDCVEGMTYEGHNASNRNNKDGCKTDSGDFLTMAERAQVILEQMSFTADGDIAGNSDGSEQVDDVLSVHSPNLESYLHVIKAWGRSNRFDGARRAEFVLDRMEADFSSLSVDSKDYHRCYEAVVYAYIRLTSPSFVSTMKSNVLVQGEENEDPLQRAENLLRRMIVRDRENNWNSENDNSRVHPSAESCAPLIFALCRRANAAAAIANSSLMNGHYNERTIDTAQLRKAASAAKADAKKAYDLLLNYVLPLYIESRRRRRRRSRLRWRKREASSDDVDEEHGRAPVTFDEKQDDILADNDELLRRCFNVVISSVGTADVGGTGAQAANRLLKTMEKLGDGGCALVEVESKNDENDHADFLPLPPLPSLSPDVVSYNSAIAAWAKSGQRGAAEQCEELLNRMYDSSSSDYSSASSTSRQETETRNHRCMSWRENVQPDVISYSTAIDAWAKSGDPRAPERAEAILRTMERRYRESRTQRDRAENSTNGQGRNKNQPQPKPNVINYTSVINAYAKSRQPGSARKAEDILNRMTSPQNNVERDDKDDAIIPDVVCYTSVIDAWASASGEEYEAPDRAEKLLNHMETLRDAGNLSMQPNVRTYTAVIQALSKSRRRGMAKRAKEILDRMERMHAASSFVDFDLRPNIFTYNYVLNACANSGGGIRKRFSFSRPQEGVTEGTEYDEEEDNDFCTSSDTVTEQVEALSIAAETYRTILKSRRLRPDSYTYAFFVKACGNLMDSGPRRDNIVRLAFERCCRDGQVSQEVFFRFQKSCSSEVFQEVLSGIGASGSRDKGRRIDASVVQVNDLPWDWTKNVRRRRKRTK